MGRRRWTGAVRRTSSTRWPATAAWADPCCCKWPSKLRAQSHTTAPSCASEQCCWSLSVWPLPTESVQSTDSSAATVHGSSSPALEVAMVAFDAAAALAGACFNHRGLREERVGGLKVVVPSVGSARRTRWRSSASIVLKSMRRPRRARGGLLRRRVAETRAVLANCSRGVAPIGEAARHV